MRCNMENNVMTVRITVETKNWPAKVTLSDGTAVEVDPNQSRLFTVSGTEAVTVVEIPPKPAEAVEEVEAPKIPLKTKATEASSEPAE